MPTIRKLVPGKVNVQVRRDGHPGISGSAPQVKCGALPAAAGKSAQLAQDAPAGTDCQSAAIDLSEDEVSINATIVLRDQFAQDSPAVGAFFDALAGLLTGSGWKQ